MVPNDPLNTRLHAAADAITVDDDFAALNAVQDGVAKRRKRRRLVTGVGVSALLIAGGVVAVSVVGDGESDSLSIAGVDEPEPTTAVDESAAGAAETDGTNADGSAPAPAETLAPPPPTTVPPSNSVVAADMIDATATYVSVPADLRDAQLNWLVPWQDGFLASRTLIVPQALPSELPEDIAALFPQEVIDFFDGELPPTIDEATQMLSEAGLLDEVTAVLSEHPEASEAIYSQPNVLPSMDVVFSSNGVDWDPVDFALPNESTGAWVQSTGDRLVALVQDYGPGFNGDERGAPPIELHVTTDLATWTEVPLPVLETHADWPSFINASTYPNGLAVNDGGWVASLSRSNDVDVEQVLPLLPADIAARYEASNGNYGADVTPDGINLYFFDDEPSITVPSDGELQRPPEPQMFEVGWQELGLSADIATTFIDGDQTIVAGRWDGEPVIVDGFDWFFGGQIVGAADGFYMGGESPRFSSDGVTWTTLDVPADTRYVQTLLPIDSGVLAVGSDVDGERTAHRVDGATNTWTPIGLPDLPRQTDFNYFGYEATSSAVVVNMAENVFPEEFEQTVEVDGYTLTITFGGNDVAVRLVDAAGTVLINDRSSSEASESPPYVREEDDGFTLIDLETGEDIVTITDEQMQAADAESEPQPSYEQPQPDLWILATVDGERWLFEDLELDESEFSFGPTSAVINGTTVLVMVGPEARVFDLG